MTGPESPIRIVMAADNAFVKPLASALASIFSHTSSPVAISVLDGGIEPGNKRRLERIARSTQQSVHWVTVDPSTIPAVRIDGHISRAAYYRLLIAELLPPDESRVIYLDSDLVLLDDVAGLWRVDLSGRALAAVRDRFAPTVSSHRGLLNYRELGIDPDRPYFNSGVLVYDLARWREERLGRRVLDYITGHPEFVRWWDQDGLNAVLGDDWVELDPRWNHVVNPDDAQERLEGHAAVVHYASDIKPWHAGYRHAAGTFHFFQHLDQTSWVGWRPSGTSLPARIAGRLANAARGVAFRAIGRGRGARQFQSSR